MPEEKKKAYVSFDAGPVTMDSGLPGVKLDFNYGARVLLPDEGTAARRRGVPGPFHGFGYQLYPVRCGGA